jgi:L,D-peptidoglycan transpeptidase YkuD (ErfK/YbiS/YcfS/YnhG family)
LWCLLILFILLTAEGCSSYTPRSLEGLGPDIGQVIVVYPTKRSLDQANLNAWQRQQSGWHRVFFGSAVIGKNGLAAAGEKREGDGKTPSGIYPIGPAFGYAPLIDTGLAYRQATDKDFWVDDARSMQYNKWVSGSPAATSFEKMKRPDDLYLYGAVIGYNMRPVIPGNGSAIFMHIWRKYYSPTAGCVALGRRNLRRILHWLNRQYQPVIILERI